MRSSTSVSRFRVAASFKLAQALALTGFQRFPRHSQQQPLHGPHRKHLAALAAVSPGAVARAFRSAGVRAVHAAAGLPLTAACRHGLPPLIRAAHLGAWFMRERRPSCVKPRHCTADRLHTAQGFFRHVGYVCSK